MRDNQADGWMIISTLILHIVNEKPFSIKQIGMIMLKNEENMGEVQEFIILLRDLRMIDIKSSCDGDIYYLYKKPDVTPLNI
ncbi:hypothetical protein [Metabacillus halosaccharovorans]|uniref:hypothetical protein n=1 Tax=Metabacillus halosaccharovorans TaxID=930124 RepID=UPI002041FA5C|nr:hypothetical protein [Metabacillus halosaccharovorans]MCM3443383.1 hypothetical protein [Metabacillus halosaccharovorans]